MKRFFLVSLSVLSALSAITPAMAQFKDSTGSIHFQTGLTANQRVEIQTGELKRKVAANFCGLLVIPVPSNAPMPASITVDAVAIDTTTLPVLSVPPCTNNTLKEPRTVNFKDASGRVALVGKTPGIQSEITYPGVPSPRTLSANACGYAKLTNSTTTPAPASFTYQGTAYTTASLPTQIPGRCYDGVKFVPQP